jgi:hypothetical protein
MSLKFRKVRRPRRSRRNPGAATTSLLISGGLIVASILVIRHFMKPKAAPAPRAPIASGPVAQLDMNVPDAGQLEGIGGIFKGGF